MDPFNDTILYHISQCHSGHRQWHLVSTSGIANVMAIFVAILVDAIHNITNGPSETQGAILETNGSIV